MLSVHTHCHISFLNVRSNSRCIYSRDAIEVDTVDVESMGTVIRT